MIKTTLLLIMLPPLILGCALSGISEDKVRFQTKITDTGLKHFEVSVPQPRPSRHERLTRPEQTERRKQRRQPSVSKLSNLEKYAQQRISSNGFCRQGYWIMDRKPYGTRVSIRGECNEIATDEDRARFPDTIEQW